METKHNRIAVKSSAVASVGYNPQTKVLQVEMTSNPGKVYDYPNFPADELPAFMAAKSMGSHLHTHIKKYAANK